MVGDSDIQVWLDTLGSRPVAVTPYVQSNQPDTLRYSVEVLQEGRGGQSRIAQTGRLTIESEVPAPLSRFSVTRQTGALCRIEITLMGSNTKERRYVFECPS